MLQQKKQYTVITGASSGIGWAAAKAFAARGCNLVLVARRQERLALLKQEIMAVQPQLDIIVKAFDLTAPENLFLLYNSLRDLPLQTWVNNAGFGDYALVARQDLAKTRQMLRLNVEAVTVLSTLFVRDFQNCSNAQLINVSSCGGYTLVPNAVTYCAAKFYVSSFTEGLAWELKQSGAKMRAKVLAPAATKTEFGQIANGRPDYDYDRAFGKYHTGEQVAALLMQLYDSDKVVGLVNREDFTFHLCDALLPYADSSQHNQKI